MLDIFFGGFFGKMGVALAGALLALTGLGGEPEPLIEGDEFEIAGEDATEEFVAETPVAEEVAPPSPKPPVANAPTPLPAAPPADICSNIGDVQKKVPEGFIAIGSICSPEEDVDRCPNLEGIQDSAPAGMTYYRNERACLTESQIERLEEEDEAEESAKTKKSAPKPQESEDAEEETATEDDADSVTPLEDKNCDDFATHAEAQAFFEAAGAGDPHRLDNNKDGLACVSLP